LVLGARFRLWLAQGIVLALAGGAAARRAAYRGAIDIGSGSSELLIVDRKGRPRVDEKLETGLGRGLGVDRLLPKANRKRQMRVLRHFIRRAARFGLRAEDLQAMATAALRNANSRVDKAARKGKRITGAHFLGGHLQGKLGLARARIVTGNEEAILSWRGALIGWRGPLPARVVVVDAGAGSHQVVAGTPTMVTAAGSTQVGSDFVATRALVDRSGAELDVITEKDFAAADRQLRAQVPRLPIDRAQVRGATPILVGAVAKLLRRHLGRDQVTAAELDGLRRALGAVPATARPAILRRDVAGRKLSRQDLELLGFHKGSQGSKVPAKLTLVRHVMRLLGARAFYLVDTDARHALVAEPE
jgi:exopolyphosphatase/guanosine-5'-triphosphate,3'-diphosphate pyrophosphatase